MQEIGIGLVVLVNIDTKRNSCIGRVLIVGIIRGRWVGYKHGIDEANIWTTNKSTTKAGSTSALSERKSPCVAIIEAIYGKTAACINASSAHQISSSRFVDGISPYPNDGKSDASVAAGGVAIGDNSHIGHSSISNGDRYAYIEAIIAVLVPVNNAVGVAVVIAVICSDGYEPQRIVGAGYA